MRKPDNRAYVNYLRKSLQRLLPVPFTDENIHLLDDVSEAIRCIEIVYGEGAGEKEMMKKRIRAADLANKKMRDEAEGKGNKFAGYGEYCRKLAFSFLFGYFISSILFKLLELLL